MSNPSDPGADRTEGHRPLQDVARIGRETVARSDAWQRAVAFGAIPVVLLVVGALPAGVQESWVLTIDAPTARALLLSNYVHGSVAHLSNNVLTYLVVMTALFPLAALAGRLRELAFAGLAFCTVGAVLVSLYSVSSLAEARVAYAWGFSGVVAAFLGALPVFIGLHLRANVAGGTSPSLVAAGLLGVELGGILLAVDAVPRWTAALVGLGLVGSVRPGWTIATSETSAPFHHRTLVVYTCLVFATVPAGLFVTVGDGVNVHAHWIGFVSGFLLPFVALSAGEVRRWRGRAAGSSSSDP